MTVQHFHRRPQADIHALKWTGDVSEIPSGWMDGSSTDGETWIELETRGVVVVHTWEGPVRPEVGEFIACGTQHELYVIRPDAMARNYEVTS